MNNELESFDSFWFKQPVWKWILALLAGMAMAAEAWGAAIEVFVPEIDPKLTQIPDFLHAAELVASMQMTFLWTMIQVFAVCSVFYGIYTITVLFGNETQQRTASATKFWIGTDTTGKGLAIFMGLSISLSAWPLVTAALLTYAKYTLGMSQWTTRFMYQIVFLESLLAFPLTIIVITRVCLAVQYFMVHNMGLYLPWYHEPSQLEAS